jgi:predicted DNA-binding transcriptional regulator AlpA
MKMKQIARNKDRDTSQSIAISAKALSQMLGVSLRQTWRLNATGKIPTPVRLGGSVRWNREEILHWFDAGCPDRHTWEAMKEVRSA